MFDVHGEKIRGKCFCCGKSRDINTDTHALSLRRMKLISILLTISRIITLLHCKSSSDSFDMILSLFDVQKHILDVLFSFILSSLFKAFGHYLNEKLTFLLPIFQPEIRLLSLRSGSDSNAFDRVQNAGKRIMP